MSFFFDALYKYSITRNSINQAHRPAWNKEECAWVGNGVSSISFFILPESSGNDLRTKSLGEFYLSPHSHPSMPNPIQFNP